MNEKPQLKNPTPLTLEQQRLLQDWWVRAEPGLLKAAERCAPSEDDAYEIVQDLALLVVRNFWRFVSSEGLQENYLRYWTYGKIPWLVLDRIRIKQRKVSGFQKFIGRYLRRSVPDDQEQWIMAREIMEAINELPKRQRAAIEGTLKGKSPEQIAADLNIETATVYSLERHARENLTEIMRSRGLQND